MSRKTGRKWKTDECSRCGEPHAGYSGKRDKSGVEYVVCGRTHKRMNVGLDTQHGRPLQVGNRFLSIWVEDDG